ncbi:hypothetical protein C8R45DRAFT_578773 [Mycena sanguinolenta]|nr:hypothetical protein C8R45DRAFT_578773 [Mycena sanguinolenta]
MTANRWEHLGLFIPRDSHPKIGRMPLLRSLDLELGTRDEVIICDAPQLRTVVLCGVIQNITLPWAQLTSLTLNYVRIDECASILRQTKSLVRCHLLSDYSRPDELLLSGADLTLPCLELLTLETPLRHVGSFLSALIVPALHMLDLQEAFLGAEPIEALKMFIAESGCRLQKVCIIGNTKTPIERYQLAFPFISVSYRPTPARAWSPEV